MRVVIADDSGIFRRGVRLLLESTGIDVLDDVADPTALLEAVARHEPDACLVDVRMPPTFSDEGLRAAAEVRRTRPGIGLLMLSTYADTVWAERLLGAGRGGTGYLLKDRVDDVEQLVGALRRVAAGGTSVDQELIAGLVQRKQVAGRLDALAPRERDTLELMAQGRSNAGIARTMRLSGKTVETYVAAVFTKLELGGEFAHPDHNRRVLAVLTYLNYST